LVKTHPFAARNIPPPGMGHERETHVASNKGWQKPCMRRMPHSPSSAFLPTKPNAPWAEQPMATASRSVRNATVRGRNRRESATPAFGARP
jgi:hypothetical protein